MQVLFILYLGTESAITYYAQNPRLAKELGIFCGRLNLVSVPPAILKYYALTPSNRFPLKRRPKFGVPTHSWSYLNWRANRLGKYSSIVQTFPCRKTRYSGQILINHQKIPDERMANPSALGRLRNRSPAKLLGNQESTSPTGSSCCSEEFTRSLACTNHSNSSAPVAGQMAWNPQMIALLISEIGNTWCIMPWSMCKATLRSTCKATLHKDFVSSSWAHHPDRRPRCPLCLLQLLTLQKLRHKTQQWPREVRWA